MNNEARIETMVKSKRNKAKPHEGELCVQKEGTMGKKEISCPDYYIISQSL